MAKSPMNDADLQSLLKKLPKWMHDSDMQAEKQIAMRKGGKVKIPKRPVSVSGKKTVPSSLNWGKGVTKDKLAYINSEEEALIRKHRGNAPVRKVNGVPAYAEETLAGPGGNKGSGGGGGDHGGSSGNSGGNAGGAGGGSSSPSNSGNKSTDDKKTAGPPRGPTDAPARTDNSAASAPKAPDTTANGPRANTSPAAKDPTQSAMNAAEKVSQDVAMKNVASGSIVGNQPKTITDRVAPDDNRMTTSMSVSQKAPAASEPNDIFSGANSPLSDSSVNSYDRNAQDAANAAKAAASSAVANNMLGPSVPAGTAGYTKDQIDARYPGAGAYQTQSPMDKALSVANNAAKAITDRVPGSVTMPRSGPAANDVSMTASVNPQTGLAWGQKIQDRMPGAADVAAGIGVNPNVYSRAVGPSQPTQLAKNSVDNVFNGPSIGKTFTERAPGAMAETLANPSYTAPDIPSTPQIMGRTNIGVRPDATSYTPGDYQKYHDVMTAAVTGNQIRDNVFNGPSAAPTASIHTPSGDISPGQLSQMDPADQQRLKDWAAANPPAATRGLAAATVPSGVHQAAISQGLAPSTNPATPSYGGPMAAVDQSPVREVSAAVPAASTTPSIDQQVSQYPSNPTPPSNPVGEYMERPFERVLGKPVSPSQADSYLGHVDNFLSSIFGRASPDSNYAHMMANADNGSKKELYPPSTGGGGGMSAMSSSTSGGKIPTVSLPPLPPYHNYQNLPGTTSPGVILPAASQPILNYINGGYADGGQVVDNAPKVGTGVAPATATAAAPASNTTGGAWNLAPVGGPPASGGGAQSANGQWIIGDNGKIVPNYANMNSQDIFNGWMADTAKGLDGNSSAMPNFMELMARMSLATDHGAGVPGGGGSGGTGGTGTGGTGGGNSGNGSGNVLGKVGVGTPGAWSGDKTGWRRGGQVNDSVANALRLARSMRA